MTPIVFTHGISDYSSLKAGDILSFSGTIYTARDAAHGRIIECVNKGDEPPFQINGNVIYYAGPTPTRPNQVIGSCGPTTSARMDDFTPQMLQLGLKAMIGKGKRSDVVMQAIKEYKAVYLCAVGGAAAIVSKHIKSSVDICYPDLGCEAVRQLKVVDLPLIVGIDSSGASILN